MSYHADRSRNIAIASGIELHTVWWEPTEPLDDQVPWLLVHGLASNARLWDGVGRRLAAAGHVAVAVDQRAHGLSAKIDGPFDMATVADDLVALLDALGWERARLVGQSWGGNVIVEAAARHPERVDLAVCVDGGFIDLRARFPQWDEARIALAPPPLAGTPLERIEAWLSESAADWPEEGRVGTLANFELTAAEAGSLATGPSVSPWLTFERHLAVLRGLWDHEPFEQFARLTTPVLVIAADEMPGSERSVEKHDSVGRAVHAAPVARAEWFSPAHHDVHAQKPAEVTELLLRAATEPGFFG